ncbi:hypothetical protein [Bounagaea algeriensis]
MSTAPRTPEELPPKPDASTGEPRPPRAPGLRKEEKPPKELDRDRDTRLSRKPTPPEGEGPVLAWYRHSQRKALAVGFTAFCILVVGITLMQGFDFRWMQFWYVWLILLVGSALIYGTLRVVNPAVGAEWLKVGKQWVRLYELTEIKGRSRSAAVHLDLVDSSGRKVMVQSDHLQEDRDMWDLVYNGMAHSVVLGGAEVNGVARSTFQLPRANTHGRS